MKRFFAIAGVALLLALNWAAVHDILIGEPDVWMEWTVVVASLVIVLAGIGFGWRKLQNRF